MKNFTISLSALFVTLVLLMGFAVMPESDEPEILGVWIRKSDNLRIQVQSESKAQLLSFIVQEGNEKFPCEVSHLPIYKHITRVGQNLWTCDFLVVTMGSCATEYEEGVIRLLKNGDMEITCPGFGKKLYAKAKPRYEK